MEIKNNYDLLDKTQKLDEATYVDLFTQVGDGYSQVPKKYAVWNVQQERVASIISDRYKIIQHRKVFEAVNEVLSELNLDINGRLDDHNDYVKADLVFQNLGTPIKDDASGIMIGMGVMNSYNMKCSYRLEMFAFRMVCQNGMSIGNAMGVREIMFHTGEEKSYELIKSTTLKFIKEAINSSSTLQRYVNEMIVDTEEWEILKVLLPKLISTKIHREEVEKRLTPGKLISRWDLYNAITNYITHDSTLKKSAQEYLEYRSRTLLKTPLIEILK
jgi:hypothetical protein